MINDDDNPNSPSAVKATENKDESSGPDEHNYQ